MKLFFIFYKIFFIFNITVLHLAVILKNAEIVDILMSQKGVDANFKDEILFKLNYQISTKIFMIPKKKFNEKRQ